MRLFALALSFALAVQPSFGAEDMFKDRPAFSGADQPAQSSVRCEDIRAMSAGIENSEIRIDLMVIGYKRLDPNHAMLDPCLANCRSGPPAQIVKFAAALFPKRLFG